MHRTSQARGATPAPGRASRPGPRARVLDLGRCGYREAWEVQRETVARRIAGEVEDTLILCEHDHVITLGRGERGEGVIDAAGMPVIEVERGGEATYHGPGQIVGYPIFALGEGERDLHRFLRGIEQAIIEAIGRFGARGERRPGLTGVWVGGRKIASIGIAVRRWVTWHGFALNVATDLARFAALRPCGMPAGVMTSLRALGVEARRDQVAAALVPALGASLGRRMSAGGSPPAGAPGAADAAARSPR